MSYVVRWCKLNAVQRLIQTKNDKGKVAIWMLDLKRIRQVVDVRPATSVRPLLTTHPKTEIAMGRDA